MNTAQHHPAPVSTSVATPVSTPVVALVTGAGTGIGRATARAFATGGAHVLAVGRREGPLAETAGDHLGIHPYAADITADGAPEEIVAAALAPYGRLDVLVNNAGIVGGQTLGALTPDGIRPQFDTNLFAPALLTQAALSALEADGGGAVVNVSTSVGQRAWPGNSLYAATKTALELLTRSWAVELAPRGIRVNAVAPGAVETPIGTHRGLSPEESDRIRDWQIAHTPLGRRGTPEEVAWAIRQLAAPEASFITGAVLPVDGGAVAG